MPLQPGTDLTQGFELLLRKIATLRHHRIERGRRVALGKDKTVARFHLGLRGIDIHLFEIEIRQDVRDRE